MNQNVIFVVVNSCGSGAHFFVYTVSGMSYMCQLWIGIELIVNDEVIYCRVYYEKLYYIIVNHKQRTVTLFAGTGELIVRFKNIDPLNMLLVENRIKHYINMNLKDGEK